MKVNWADVNKDFYGMDIGENENIERTEFASGRVRTRKKNSVAKNIFSVLIEFEDVGPDSEFKRFVFWWKNILQSGANTVELEDLLGSGVQKEYRPTAFEARGQKRKEVAMTLEEI